MEDINVQDKGGERSIFPATDTGELSKYLLLSTRWGESERVNEGSGERKGKKGWKERIDKKKRSEKERVCPFLKLLHTPSYQFQKPFSNFPPSSRSLFPDHPCPRSCDQCLGTEWILTRPLPQLLGKELRTKEFPVSIHRSMTGRDVIVILWKNI